MDNTTYINQKNKEYQLNIDEFEIGQEVMYKNKYKTFITNKTANSIEVFLKKETKEGINCLQWFTIKDFNTLFKK